MGRANTLLSSSAPPVLEGPSCLPLLISRASLLCPQDQCSQGDRGPWRAGHPPGSSAGAPGPSGRGKRPPLLPDGSSRLPVLIPPASLLCPQGPTRPGEGFGGQGIGLGDQQPPWAPVGGAITLHSSPTPPGWPLLPATPDLPCLPPVPSRTHTAWRGLWRGGTGLGAQQAPQACVGQGNALHSSSALPGGSLPPASPGLPWPQRRQSCLASISPPPSIPPRSTGSLGGSSHLLGLRVPHQRPAGALFVGRH